MIKKISQDLESFAKKISVQEGLQKVHEQPLRQKHLVAFTKLDAKGLQDMRRESESNMQLAELGEQITEQGLTKEIELYARLEARIDRLLKRLFQLEIGKTDERTWISEA